MTVTLELVNKLPRQCGDCQLCCKLLPVQEIGKLAGVRCRHQAHGVGCRVYGPGMPSSCRLWSCAWLTGSFNGRRPDRTHYVVDILPDFITAVDDASGRKVTVPVVQVWCDPGFPLAHRDPDLRKYLDERGKDGVAALIRYGSGDAFALIPPAMGGWIETERKPPGEKQHTFAQVAQALGSGRPAST